MTNENQKKVPVSFGVKFDSYSDSVVAYVDQSVANHIMQCIAQDKVIPEWRPIETAPKDGTLVLLYGIWDDEIYGPGKEPEIGTGLFKKSYRLGVEAWMGNRGGHPDERCKATLWSPITPPAMVAAAQEGSE